MRFSLFMAIGLSATMAMAQARQVDPVAVSIMDRMASVIGNLQSCSFSLSASNDINDYPYGMTTHFTESEVQMLGPDKMLIHSRGDDHHKGFWYNGDKIVYYSYAENNYAVMDAPGNILSAIDSVHHTYGIDFPAADFFYPTFTDDILVHFDEVQYIGEKKLNDKECFHIKASNKDMVVQFWIADDAFNLPMRFSIVYLNEEGSPRYEATFKDWKMNPVLPEAIFEFAAPPGARQIAIAVKSTTTSKK
ncbi:DUF2092 domain-containing protein [Owenweeksia hongkongensis]|uniref:DUF2092 domain-containing protein n=1 Tax=Owenweeksia hongkongensis TaxID=253245 RepID=UPI003A909CAE